jgi:kynurenine formamidase
MSDHASTHIDAIVHFGQRSGTAEQIPLEYCYGEGIALDLSHKKPKEYITVADIEKELKKKRLRINKRDVVLIHTGASKHWGTAKYFEYIVPIEAGAVRELYRRGVRVIGVDEITIDNDPTYPAHSLAKELDWYHIENMANIDKIPRPRFKFIGLPLKLVGASAAPMRAVAIVED